MAVIYRCLIALLLISPCSIAQHAELRLKAGYGQYDMADIKLWQGGIQGELIELFRVPVKIVDKFSGYFNPQMQVVWQLKPNLKAGFTADFASTTGRLHYRDYSGEITIDQFVNRLALGVVAEQTVRSWQYGNIAVFSSLTALRSRVRIEGAIRVLDTEDLEETNGVAYGVAIAPGLAAAAGFSRVKLRIEVGLEYNFSRDLKLEGEEEVVLNGLGVQWTGFRGGLTLLYVLPRSEGK